MRLISPQPCLLNRLLQVIFLSAALIGLPLALNAQTSTPDRTSASSPPPPLAEADSQITYEDIGDSLLVKRRYQRAIEEYRKAGEKSSKLWNKMGIAYQMMFDIKDAERCYRKSLRLSPHQPWALNNLATLYGSRGHLAKAEELYRKALEIAPDSARIMMNLGTNLIIQKKYNEGSEMYRHALARDPDLLDKSEGPVFSDIVPLEQRAAMNYSKAQGYAQAGMTGNAIKYLKKALNQGFTSPGRIASDSSFTSLHGNPAFERLMAGHE